MTITTMRIPLPVGDLAVAERDGAVVALVFDDHADAAFAKVRERFPDDDWVEGACICADSLDRYAAGDFDAVDDVAVDLGGTEFQSRVWAALRTIPAGETWSYADLAAAVGSPNGFRAVGSANGANPVCIVVPCHRVVRTDGNIGGYAGGVARKEWLLRHEGARLV